MRLRGGYTVSDPDSSLFLLLSNQDTSDDDEDVYGRILVTVKSGSQSAAVGTDAVGVVDAVAIGLDANEEKGEEEKADTPISVVNNNGVITPLVSLR